MSKQIEPHILEFYTQKKLLGSGAYGHVWKVVEKQSNQTFALKKIFDAFQNSTDAQRTYREISLLHEMQHNSIIKLHKVIKSRNKKDLYLVFEYMESDLHSLVGQNILSSSHIVFVLYQTLKALKYCHSAQLIHRDLKPSNILINSDCEIKVCDFGLARTLACEEDTQNILSEEVATRWYRSPEMLLGSRNYDKPTDVWSLGCIVAELMIGQPIFQGSSTLDQLQKIMDFTGMPSKYSIDSLKSENAENIICNLSVRKKSVKDYFRHVPQDQTSKELVELTVKMLQFNPNKRLIVEQILENPIFSQFKKNESSEEDQELCNKFLVPNIDDNVKLTLKEYRNIIYKDIERRYPEFNDAKRIKSIYSVKKAKNSSFTEHLAAKSNQRGKSLKQKHHSSFHVKDKASSSLNKASHESSLLKQKKLTKCKSSKSLIKAKTKSSNNLGQQSLLKDIKNQSIFVAKEAKSRPLRDFEKKGHSAVQSSKKLQKEKKQNAVENSPDQVASSPSSFIKSNPTKKTHVKPSPFQTVGFLQVGQKAEVYKSQLKKMKSTKTLVKKKASKKPVFGRNNLMNKI